jgi:hypothetical protein
VQAPDPAADQDQGAGAAAPLARSAASPAAAASESVPPARGDAARAAPVSDRLALDEVGCRWERLTGLQRQCRVLPGPATIG